MECLEEHRIGTAWSGSPRHRVASGPRFPTFHGPDRRSTKSRGLSEFLNAIGGLSQKPGDPTTSLSKGDARVTDQPGGIQRSVQVGKDLFALMREVVIVGALVVFLTAPEHVNSLLVKAGFTEGSIGGFKWVKLREQAEKANADAATAGNTITQVEEELKATRKQLDELSKKVQDPAVKADIQDLSSQIKTSEQKTAVADDTLKSSVRAHTYVLEQIQRVEPPPTDQKLRMRAERP